MNIRTDKVGKENELQIIRMVSAIRQVARISIVAVTANKRIFIIINVDLTGD